MKSRGLWNKYWKIIILFIFLSIFTFLASGVVREKLHNFDTTIYQFIIQFKTFWLTNTFKIITSFSNSICLLLLCLIAIFIFNNKQKAAYLFLNLVNICILNTLLKEIFSRSRPFELMLIEENGYSFPSGHSMASMAFYGFIIYLISQSKWNKKWKYIFYFVLCLLIFLIGLSRIYLGVHYASDVIAGFSISFVYLLIFIYFVSRSKRWKDV